MQLCVTKAQIKPDSKLLSTQTLYWSITAVYRVSKSGKMRRVGHVARTKDRRVAYRVLVGRPDIKSQLVRPNYRWDDNIKMYIL
jgi:hypothetical protein